MTIKVLGEVVDLKQLSLSEREKIALMLQTEESLRKLRKIVSKRYWKILNYLANRDIDEGSYITKIANDLTLTDEDNEIWTVGKVAYILNQLIDLGIVTKGKTEPADNPKGGGSYRQYYKLTLSKDALTELRKAIVRSLLKTTKVILEKETLEEKVL